MKLSLLFLALSALAVRSFSAEETGKLKDGTSLYPAFKDGKYDFTIDFPQGADDVEWRRRVTKACWKDSEPRGKGHMPDHETRDCPETQEKSMGLCYPKCGAKRVGFGPLCLDDCQATAFKSSAAFFCCDSDEICSDLMKDAAMKLPRALVRLAIDIAANPSDARKIANDFREFMADAMQLRLPLCSKLGTDDAVEFELEAVAVPPVVETAPQAVGYEDVVETAAEAAVEVEDIEPPVPHADAEPHTEIQ